MRNIIEEIINKILSEKQFKWFFDIEKDGLYGLEIVASGKSWRQNFSIYDDDLAVKIDRTSFPQKKDTKKLFDGEAAWNGNNLKGLKKTVLFILPMRAGSHILKFLANSQPFLESIRIFQIEENKISYLPQDNPPKDGNRRQWLSVVLNNVGLDSIFVEAIAQLGQDYPNFFHDDGDLKIVINGVIQKNFEKKSYKNWYWCGRTLKGESKQLSQKLNLQPDLHYLEFYADRSPVVQNIAINLGDNIQTQESFLPRAKVIAKEANLRTEPRVASSILATLKKGDEVFIFPKEKAIKGDAPYEKQNDHTNTWHKVKFQGKEGYIFAKFLEIQGEDKDSMRAKIIASAKKYAQDPCLMLAIAQRESQFFPYVVSKKNAFGLFQLKTSAIEQVQKKFNKDIKNFDFFNVDHNIEFGVLYFKYLKEVYQKEKDPINAIKQQLAAWNWGQGNVPSNARFDLGKQPLETRQFIKDVLKYKQQCQDIF